MRRPALSDQDGPENEIQTLPLDAWHRARGGRMVEFAGYHMPVQYEGIMAEHLWVRDSAGLFDVSHMGQIVFSGDGLDDALEALLPADVKSLALGKMRYSLLLAENGGILDDLMLARWPESIYMVVNGAVKYDDIAHLRMELPDEITLNQLDERVLLALQGPKAFEVLKRHTTGRWDLDALTFMTGGPFELAGAVNNVAPGIYVQKMEISIVGNPFGVVEVPINIKQLATLNANNITVVIL